MFLRGLGVDQPVAVKVPLTPNMFTNHGMTGWTPVYISDGDRLTQGWHSDGKGIGTYFVVDLGRPLAIVRAVLDGGMPNSGDMWTNAIYTIDYSDDLSTWTSVTAPFTITNSSTLSEMWSYAGAHRYWRVYVTGSKQPDGDTSGGWFGELELYSVPEIITAPLDLVVPSSFTPPQNNSLLNMKVAGVPIIYAGGGLLSLIILLKLLRK